jgi:hypothetical protein
MVMNILIYTPIRNEIEKIGQLFQKIKSLIFIPTLLKSCPCSKLCNSRPLPITSNSNAGLLPDVLNKFIVMYKTDKIIFHPKKYNTCHELVYFYILFYIDKTYVNS